MLPAHPVSVEGIAAPSPVSAQPHGDLETLRGAEILVGEYALQAMDPGWVTARQIEAARQTGNGGGGGSLAGSS
jgi:hypothetical protein